MSFKKGKRRPRHARCANVADDVGAPGPSSTPDGDGDDDTGLRAILRDTMELQKTRERHSGVTTEQLMTIKERPVEKEDMNDPFGLNKGGGLVGGSTKGGGDAMESFAESTAQMDDNKLMKKFVEVEMAKRYGKVSQHEQEPDVRVKGSAPIDLQREVFAVEEKYQKKVVDDEAADRNAEALSGALLTSVPEVDLGISERLKTIEATEEARRSTGHAGAKRNKLTEQYRFKSFRPQSEAMGRRSERKGPRHGSEPRAGGDKREERSTDMQTMRRYRNYVQGLRR